MAKKPGVMIYFETGQSIKGLDYETKGRLFEAIMEYGEHGTVPPMDGILAAVWPFIASKIDRDAQSYEKTVQARKRAIYARWWPKYCAENNLDPQNKEAKERWIDQQIEEDAHGYGVVHEYTKNTNVSGAVQTIPTITVTTTGTITGTGTTTGTVTRAGTTGAEPSPPTPTPRAYGLYWNVMLTDDEYLELHAEIPNLQNEVNKLSEYMKSTGKHYDSHAATIRKWAREDAEKEAEKQAKQEAQARRNSGNAFLDALKGGDLD